jgi:uncharacterized membrane protein YqjE
MGLLQSTQALVASVLGLARTRLDLLSTELQEVLARLVLLMVGAVAAIVLGALAITFGAVALLMAVPEGYRVWATAGIAVAFLAGALFLGRQVQREAKAMPFAASLAELQRDLEALNSRE